jgi:photosystem I subunit 12
MTTFCNKLFPNLGKTGKSSKRTDQNLLRFGGFDLMHISDTQVYIALVVALIPGILAWRLSTELYKS